jgi:hypothetical protein
MLWGLLLSRGLISCTTDTRSGKKCKSILRISLTVPIDRLVSWVNLRMDLFEVSAILCQPLQYFQLFFSTAFFAQNTTCFQKHVYAFIDFLGPELL